MVRSGIHPPLTVAGWLRFVLVRRFLGEQPWVRSVLEVGPGEGALGARLAEIYDYIGLEPDPGAFSVAAKRVKAAGGGSVINSVSLPPELRHQTFDLVCAFEVLEHIEDDEDALGQWRSYMRDQGCLVMTVPAHAARFGPCDERVGHCRRYDPGDMGALLDRAGYDVERLLVFGYPSGNFLETIRNVLARFSKPVPGSREARGRVSGRWFQPRRWMGPATFALALPLRLLQARFIGNGRGTSLFVVAKRRGSKSA